MGELTLFKNDNGAPRRKVSERALERVKQLITSTGIGNRISIRGKQFRFNKDGKEVSKLKIGMPIEVVILQSDPDQGTAKAYFKDAYNPDIDQLPDCHSADGIKPDTNCESPQNKTCADCKWNAFGTGTDAQGNPGKGKACADYKNLFVLLEDRLDGDIWNLRVPATSLKPLSNYGRKLIENSTVPEHVRTRISFDEETDHPQLEFDAYEFLTDDEADITEKVIESPTLSSLLPSKLARLLPSPAAGDSDDGTQAIPPPKPSAPVMTEKAGKISYESFIKQGWTDEQLIANGYMET